MEKCQNLIIVKNLIIPAVEDRKDLSDPKIFLGFKKRKLSKLRVLLNENQNLHWRFNTNNHLMQFRRKRGVYFFSSVF